MTASELEQLARRRAARAAALERVHNELVARLERAIGAGEDVNVKRLAELADVSRATIYNTLSRRQEARDRLTNGGPPSAAPHDDTGD